MEFDESVILFLTLITDIIVWEMCYDFIRDKALGY